MKFPESKLNHFDVCSQNHDICFVLNQGSFLQTAVVKVAKQEKQISCRLILDSGSQRSYVNKSIVEQLELKPLGNDQLIVYTFGSDSPIQISSPIVEIEIVTKRNIRKRIQVNVVSHITEDIAVPQISDLNLPLDILADDGSLGERIDLLIGNDYYLSFVKPEHRKINEGLTLVNTEFGWIASGKRDSSDTKDKNALSVITYSQCHGQEDVYYTEPDLPLKNMDLTFLWALESVGIMDNPKTTREEEAIRHFNNTIKYVDGR